MKNKAKFILLTISFISFSNSAHALKFVIYTDEASGQVSEQVADLMKNTYPFNKFDIEVEIVKVPSNSLECFSSDGIERAITCKDLDHFQNDTLKRGGDQAMVVKDIGKYGGASKIGGGVPVMTTASSPRVMLHEYMHTLGLCDEYEYQASEADAACDQKGANLAFIEPEEPYWGDRSARNKHRWDIPWYDDIASITSITNSKGKKLGTGDVKYEQAVAVNLSKMPSVLRETTGLYKGKNCKNATYPKVVWHPGMESTVMNKVTNGLGAPLEKIVERLLSSKGVRKKMQINERVSSAPKEYHENGEHPAQISQLEKVTSDQVDDSKRGFFKSLLYTFKNIFENMTHSLTK